VLIGAFGPGSSLLGLLGGHHRGFSGRSGHADNPTDAPQQTTIEAHTPEQAQAC
jgi:hypothetical protein